MNETTTANQRWSTFDSLHRDVSSRIDRQVQDELGISMREYRALTALKEHDPSSGPQVRTVSAATGLSASATSRLLGRLHRRGLITLHTSSTDRRILGVALTSQADGLMGKGSSVVETVTAAALAALNPAEINPLLLLFLQPSRRP
ncbi:MarR family winged helix-turn-helix transcriptional regulator [Streptomyces sp. NPDC089424]|uniref:MarR family winged helix-turn-helix transcriptional regulator n=1 Tax=Streptomyces sp. NPDC089424 TaxID=3365917 RepID=UPI0037F4458F